MTIHKKQEDAKQGDTRWRKKFLVFPLITKEIILWGIYVDILEVYKFDSVSGTCIWTKSELTYYDKNTQLYESIKLN